MTVFKKMNPYKVGLLALRFGLAGTYLYSGLSLISNPEKWIGFIPSWFQNTLPIQPELYLQFQGGFELILAFAFITGILLRPAALISALEMTGILLFLGPNLITFRDMGLLGGAVALFLFSFHGRTNTTNTN